MWLQGQAHPLSLPDWLASRVRAGTLERSKSQSHGGRIPCVERGRSHCQWLRQGAMVAIAAYQGPCSRQRRQVQVFVWPAQQAKSFLGLSVVVGVAWRPALAETAATAESIFLQECVVPSRVDASFAPDVARCRRKG